MNDSAGPVAPAGWYPDSEIAGQLRFWDGSSWTSHTSPVDAPPPSAVSKEPSAQSSRADLSHRASQPPQGPPAPSTQTPGPDANTIADGVLRAVMVVVAFLLVIGLTIALVVKSHQMSSMKHEGEHVLYDQGLGPGASPMRVQIRSEVLADEARKVRSAAGGPLAGIAGDPADLKDLADQLDEESRRLAQLAVDETQAGLS
jgi:hypothetical protein